MVCLKVIAIFGCFFGFLPDTTAQSTYSASSTVATATSTIGTLTPTGTPSAVTLKISTKSGTRNKTAPLLHGLFFEDINVSTLVDLGSSF